MRTQRRPLIEEHRRSWGLPATVHRVEEDVRALQLADRSGDLTINQYIAGGGGGGSGGSGGISDVPDIWDAIVDSASPLVGTLGLYATAQAAIDAGAQSIWYRTSTDAATIVIDSGDTVARIAGDTAQTAVVPVSIDCTKDDVLLEGLKLTGVYVFMGGARARLFACLFTGEAPHGQALINSAAGIEFVTLSIPYDSGTGKLLRSVGYGRIDQECLAWSAGGGAVSGTLTVESNRRGILETVAQQHLDNATIDSMTDGNLILSGADADVTACFFVGCSGTYTSTIVIEPTATSPVLSKLTFIGNSTWFDVAFMPYATATSTVGSHEAQIVGCKWLSSANYDGIIGVLPGADSSAGRVLLGMSSNGNIVRGFSGRVYRQNGGGWNISGGVIDGVTKNAQTLTFQRDGGSYTDNASDSGGASTGTSATTLTDTGKAWTVNAWTGYWVESNGKKGRIVSNTATVLTVVYWVRGTPTSGNSYRIFGDQELGYTVSGAGSMPGRGIVLQGTEEIAYSANASTTDSGASTAVVGGGGGVAPTMTDSGKAWTTDQWKGQIVETNGKSALVISNTATVLTLDRWLGGTPATGQYQIRATLLGCRRGFNGTTATTIADGATASNISQIVVDNCQVDTALRSNELTGISFDSVRVLSHVADGEGFSVSNWLWADFIVRNVTTFYCGASYTIQNVTAGASAGTFDVRGKSGVSFAGIATSHAITNPAASTSMWSPALATPPTGLGTATYLATGGIYGHGRVAGDEVPGAIPLVNRTGANSVAQHVVILDTANDYSFVETAAGGHAGRFGVCMEGGIANLSTALIATQGTALLLCDGTVTRGDYLETSTTAGIARSAGAAKTAASFARALQARAGAGSSAILVALCP